MSEARQQWLCGKQIDTAIAAMRDPKAVDAPSMLVATRDGGIGLFLREKCEKLEFDAESGRMFAEALLQAATQCDGLKTEIVVCGTGRGKG